MRISSSCGTHNAIASSSRLPSGVCTLSSQAAPHPCPLRLPTDRCKYDYEGQSEFELTYRLGDTVVVLSKEEDPWYQCELEGHGIKGMAYKDFLEAL